MGNPHKDKDKDKDATGTPNTYVFEPSSWKENQKVKI